MSEVFQTVLPLVLPVAFLKPGQELSQIDSLLAQTGMGTNQLNTGMNGLLQAVGLGALGPAILNLLGAIAILLLGWLVAIGLSSLTRNLLKRTDLDNRLVQLLSGQPASATPPNVEKWASILVFWIILLVAVVAFLDALKLTAVADPLNNLLRQIFAFLPKLGSAVLLAAIAWLVATLTKTLVTRTSRSFGLDERLIQQAEGTPAQNQFLLSETLGNALYWFILLFFLPLILGVLELQGPLQPVQNLLNDILSALPKILKAVLIGGVGWFIARVVREILTNLLAAAGADQVGRRFGLSRSTGGQSLSWLVGTIVYVLILIPTVIAALDALQIPALSAPAITMLNQVLGAIPQIFTAALILVIAFGLGRFVADLITNILTGIGFDNIFYWLGLQSTPTAQAPTPAPAPDAEDTVGQPTVLQESATVLQPSRRTPSEIVGIVVLVGILLFATVAATNVLRFEALTTLISGLIVIFGRILAGLVVFAIGLYLANLAFNLISSSGNSQTRILAQTARISIIALITAMALQQMGIAPNIVNLAFGLLLGAIAVAIALAFGLGGRDIAAEQIREWLSSFKQQGR